MTLDTPTSLAGPQVTTAPSGGKARVIVLRGAIRGEVAEELRRELLSALDAGVLELVLDLSEVESISSSARDLVAAASITLANRGGVLLSWSEKYASDEPVYVMTEMRDRTLAALDPVGRGERSREAEDFRGITALGRVVSSVARPIACGAHPTAPSEAGPLVHRS